MRKTSFLPEQDDEMIRLYVCGVTYSQIGEMMQRAPKSCYYRISRLVGPHHTQQRAEAMKKRRTSGCSAYRQDYVRAQYLLLECRTPVHIREIGDRGDVWLVNEAGIPIFGPFSDDSYLDHIKQRRSEVA